MPSLSEKLRRERELRGISLKQISDDTKIGVRFLQALEEGRIELIPGEFYRRSYLRAYAKYLGLDEDRAVNAYAFSNQEKDPDEPGVDDRSEPRAARHGMAAWLPWVVVACVAVLIVVFFLRSGSAPAESAQNVTGRGLERAQPVADVADGSGVTAVADAAGTAATAADSERSPSVLGANPPVVPPTRARDDVPMLTPSGAPASSSRSTSPASRGDVPGDGRLRLVVAVGESCWLEIQADGEVVSSGLREEGFRQELTADSEMRLWLGNAAGVSFWVNGRPLKPLGRPGQVRKDLSITPDNFMDYVAAEPGPS